MKLLDLRALAHHADDDEAYAGRDEPMVIY
jgi:hypothetical protein